MEGEERIVRVPLPDDLIRQIDELVRRRRGGFRTREELIREAVHQMALELQYRGEASAASTSTVRFEAGRPAQQALSEEPDWAAGSGSLFARTESGFEGAPRRRRFTDEDLSFTRLHFIPPLVTAPLSTGWVKQEPLFGLHNRDYPTLWAATKLAEMTTGELIPDRRFRAEILPLAWEIGARIVDLEPRQARKLAASFPTNLEKKQSAEDAFWNFVVGTSGGDDESGLELSGPFYLWGIAGGERREKDFVIGLTDVGVELLADLEGLQLDMRSKIEPYADRFFAHLRERVPSDWWGFDAVVRLIGRDGTTRTELVQAFHRELEETFKRTDGWSEVQAATNAAGYVARAREWGLVGHRLERGRYWLTDFGENMLAGL